MAELYLVEFKGSRREFFYNTYYHSLAPSDHVIIQAEQGEDIGMVTKKIETGVEVAKSTKPRSILRPAGDTDRQRMQKLRDDETGHKDEIVRLVARHGLDMKVIDVECQFDGSKITYYFTADHRVDFRALVRDLAARHKTRIELRQIGVRDEARRVGGYGICGRVQCCSNHIREFEPISTQHAREQDLSLNPSKISGNCGRLLCCLRYEADQYSEIKKMFPPAGSFVVTEHGSGNIERIDIFNEEAIVVDDNNISFRVKPGDILKSDNRKKTRPVRSERDDDDDSYEAAQQDSPEIDENEAERSDHPTDRESGEEDRA